MLPERHRTTCIPRTTSTIAIQATIPVPMAHTNGLLLHPFVLPNQHNHIYHITHHTHHILSTSILLLPILQLVHLPHNTFIPCNDPIHHPPWVLLKSPCNRVNMNVGFHNNILLIFLHLIPTHHKHTCSNDHFHSNSHLTHHRDKLCPPHRPSVRLSTKDTKDIQDTLDIQPHHHHQPIKQDIRHSKHIRAIMMDMVTGSPCVMMKNRTQVTSSTKRHHVHIKVQVVLLVPDILKTVLRAEKITSIHSITTITRPETATNNTLEGITTHVRPLADRVLLSHRAGIRSDHRVESILPLPHLTTITSSIHTIHSIPITNSSTDVIDPVWKSPTISMMIDMMKVNIAKAQD